jgi:LytS/YehU family sensor histidine kinase
VDAAERVLVMLSALLRTTLEASDTHEVPLREEIAFLETYLEIERTRFADRLSYVVDVDPAALDARVPSLILQPLVENAVKHGVARRASPGRVEVTAARRNGTIELTVHDDGPGGGAEPGPGVGLANTRARLEQLYGADHRFEAVGADGAGFTVSLAFPYRRAE